MTQRYKLISNRFFANGERAFFNGGRLFSPSIKEQAENGGNQRVSNQIPQLKTLKIVVIKVDTCQFNKGDAVEKTKLAARRKQPFRYTVLH
jgi:hypothetical protein